MQNSPHLAPFVDVNKLSQQKERRLVDIVKTKNYANCDKRIAYNFGVPEDSNWENPANNMIRVNKQYIRFFELLNILKFIMIYLFIEIHFGSHGF